MPPVGPGRGTAPPGDQRNGPRSRSRDWPCDWLAAREAGIRPEVASCLQWAGSPGQVADLAILYVHGFSASPAELRPLPEDLSRVLSANLLSLRLAGHGQGGAELAASRVADWSNDLADGLAVAQQIGRRVVLLGMSTGATLAALAAREPARGAGLAGVVLLSPNFRLRARAARLLDLPGSRTLLRLLGDPERGFRPRNPLHAAGWTSRYPRSALLEVGAVLRHARRGNYRAATAPALFIWSDADRIIDHRASARVAASWGGAARVVTVAPGPRDDPDAHVLAGAALSPDLTGRLLPMIAGWIRSLG